MTLTDTERLRLATNTRQFGTRLERDLARALTNKAAPRPHAIGILQLLDTIVPIEARFRLWMPLDLPYDYTNEDMRCGLILLRSARFLEDHHDGTTWSAVLTPLLVPAIDADARGIVIPTDFREGPMVDTEAA